MTQARPQPRWLGPPSSCGARCPFVASARRDQGTQLPLVSTQPPLIGSFETSHWAMLYPPVAVALDTTLPLTLIWHDAAPLPWSCTEMLAYCGLPSGLVTLMGTWPWLLEPAGPYWTSAPLVPVTM